ncbi:Arc family DNA-binding protein [Kibdelosporangium persicum]|uniref:Toxin-antitoxin system VapB family antidote component n=1 Tax=Kibdelosporangium persicum TaxID=2698649 RepID=A0ABX2F9G4_9PSEU|nr:Arc family DNA-binding protein [Kibdelosporangium persicum]NRN67848.1 Toxin-antitoxin system VapB family antidote component [Kibdelosporangium persicum]
MATLTIRGLDEEVRERLRVRAAEHGRSMEAEVRAILRETLFRQTPAHGLGSRIRARFADIEDHEFAIPTRDESPRAVDLDT